jgi:N-acetylmuramoyl-L-alanine amidase
MKRLASLALSVAAWLMPLQAAIHSVTAVRHWSVSDVTRIVIEVSGEFEYRSDRLHDPERIYFDVLAARPHIEGRHAYTEHLTDPLVSRIRVALHAPDVTRVVLDLNGDVEVSASRLANPSRLVIELRRRAPALPAETTSAPPTAPPIAAPAPSQPAKASVPAESKETAAGKGDVPKTEIPKTEESKPALGPPAAEIGKSARHTSDGQTSLVRALGLKIGRIVIDPGHGGHDQGTEGVSGLLEKDLVLDVARRVGKLVEEKMGAEVIYTRTDDTFIPLESRTALANEKKADLFLSIHANSSPVPRIAGVETYYLNLTTARDALDVASRENASSQKSIFELQDLIQKITMRDKAEESREFASRVQGSLYAFSLRNFPGTKNRGVKKAPFVVLIGAHMPSILAEIGFLSNPREEALLKKADYRQRLAEALFRGVQRYAESLSHFQVAQAKDK